jgi:hypothetical protein
MFKNFGHLELRFTAVILVAFGVALALAFSAALVPGHIVP